MEYTVGWKTEADSGENNGGSTLREAIILAGGLGERLRPLTERIPKPLIPVGGRPILEWQIYWLHKYGVKRVVLAVGYLHEKFVDHFRRSPIDVEIDYSVEREKLGTGGAIKRALEKIEDSSVIVTNGDNLMAINIREVEEYHRRMRNSGTIVVVPFRSPYGIVEIFNGLLMSFKEKPTLPYWINAGLYIFNVDEVHEKLPDKGDIESEFFPNMIGKLSVFMSRELWMPVDTPKDLKRAEEMKQTLYKAIMEG
ncbi:nucleotidyltransferase [Candidatus Bathyarchaeota archaeon ex4484_205]|nr:MAG: nucleotidyltransferase [Candidatus Bathyarchaeota archaeon ex4484_205]